MSTGTVVLNTNSQLNINRDISQVFLGNNRFENVVHTNVTGAEEVLVAGTVMGRIAATGLLLPLIAAAVDGSQYPSGILANDVTLAIGASATVSICVEGEVAEEKLIFNAAETLLTVVDGRNLRDRIAADTVGIKLITSTDLTGFDNQ